MDPREDLVRSMIRAGKADEEIADALKAFDEGQAQGGGGARSTGTRVGSGLKGLATGLVADPLSLPLINEGRKAAGDIREHIAQGNLTRGQAVSEMAKGSGQAVQALADTLIAPVDQTFIKKGSGAVKPPMRQAASLGTTLKSLDPGKGSEGDPEYAWGRRAGNALTLLLGPKALTKLMGAKASTEASALTKAAATPGANVGEIKFLEKVAPRPGAVGEMVKGTRPGAKVPTEMTPTFGPASSTGLGKHAEAFSTPQARPAVVQTELPLPGGFKTPGFGSSGMTIPTKGTLPMKPPVPEPLVPSTMGATTTMKEGRIGQRMGLPEGEIAEQVGRKPTGHLNRVEVEAKGKLTSGIDPMALVRFAKQNPKLAGAAIGGTAGYLVADENNSDEQLGLAALGATGGMGVGAGLANPSKIVPALLGVRREAMLSGGAIPKNILTAAGAPLRSAALNLTPGTGRLAAAKEMYNPVKNLAELKKSWAKPQFAHQQHQGMSFGRKGIFSHAIGAIDDTATKALQRAGMSEDDIRRSLLTGERNMFKPVKEGVHPIGQTVIDTMFPFQRVPTNVLAEAAHEAGMSWQSLKDMGKKGSRIPTRALVNAAATGGGALLGHNAKTPKQKFLATILLALAGPSTGLATIGAATAAGSRGLGYSSFGGLSPVPEQAFDWHSYLGIGKPALVNAAQKLSGK